MLPGQLSARPVPRAVQPAIRPDTDPQQKAAALEDRIFQSGGYRRIQRVQLLNVMSASLKDRVAPYTCWYTGNSRS